MSDEVLTSDQPKTGGTAPDDGLKTGRELFALPYFLGDINRVVKEDLETVEIETSETVILHQDKDKAGGANSHFVVPGKNLIVRSNRVVVSGRIEARGKAIMILAREVMPRSALKNGVSEKAAIVVDGTVGEDMSKEIWPTVAEQGTLGPPAAFGNSVS
jgi:hypothetical protein